jgi:hypothetical protein
LVHQLFGKMGQWEDGHPHLEGWWDAMQCDWGCPELSFGQGLTVGPHYHFLPFQHFLDCLA